MFSLQKQENKDGKAKIDHAPKDGEKDARRKLRRFLQPREPSGIRVGQESSDHAHEGNGQEGDRCVDEDAFRCAFHKTILCKSCAIHSHVECG